VTHAREPPPADGQPRDHLALQQPDEEAAVVPLVELIDVFSHGLRGLMKLVQPGHKETVFGHKSAL